MDLYLAGSYSRIYVHELWMSTLLEKMGNPVSFQKFIGGGVWKYILREVYPGIFILYGRKKQ